MMCFLFHVIGGFSDVGEMQATACAIATFTSLRTIMILAHVNLCIVE
jgi:hypothetical protein